MTESQKRGRVEVSAPEEQQEADGGHECADADARRVDFDVQGGPADDQQQHGHARRGQRPDQDVGPAGLDQRRVVLQAVVLLELGEALHDAVGQAVLFGLRAGEPQRNAGDRDQRALFPLAGPRLFGQFGVAEVFHVAQPRGAEDVEVRIDHGRHQRPGAAFARGQLLLDDVAGEPISAADGSMAPDPPSTARGCITN